MFDNDDDDFDHAAEQVAGFSTRVRTFRVWLEGSPEPVVLQATSYATEMDVAKFYRVDEVVEDGERDLVLINHRCLRPFVDIEDISHDVVAMPESVN